MRRILTVGAAFAALTTACTTTGVGHGISISPPPSSESPSITPSPSSSGSPGPESVLTTGTATLTLSGDLTLTIVMTALGPSAVWGPPPAPMDITWQGPGVAELHLAGTSFLSRAPTSADRVLAFTVVGPEGPVAFSSSAGECSITITPALPDNMGGLFTCTSLSDVEGIATVDARGLFSASG